MMPIQRNNRHHLCRTTGEWNPIGLMEWLRMWRDFFFSRSDHLETKPVKIKVTALKVELPYRTGQSYFFTFRCTWAHPWCLLALQGGKPSHFTAKLALASFCFSSSLAETPASVSRSGHFPTERQSGRFDLWREFWEKWDFEPVMVKHRGNMVNIQNEQGTVTQSCALVSVVSAKHKPPFFFLFFLTKIKWRLNLSHKLPFLSRFDPATLKVKCGDAFARVSFVLG